MNPFCTFEARLTIRSKLRSRGHTHELSMEIDLPVPCKTRSRTGTQHWALGWHNKSCARIIPCAYLQFFCHQCETSLPPLILAQRARPMYMNGDNLRWNTEEIFWRKNQGYRYINQGSDRNRTKIGKPKVTNIEYNRVAPFIDVHIYKIMALR